MIKYTILLLLFLLPINANAHKSSDSYLLLDITDRLINIQWDIALRDLENAIGLDQNSDGKISWKELKQKHNTINQYAFSRLMISNNNSPCKMMINENRVNNHSDGAYSVIYFTATCVEKPDNIMLDYNLLFDLDSQHRGLVKISHKQQTRSFIMSPEDHLISSPLLTSNWQQFLNFIREGIFHILAGFDHILFLISILLPAVLYRTNSQWVPQNNFKSSFIDASKIVSAFTLAHSVTLGLAVFNIITLPSTFIESAIALSVIIVAINNLYPVINSKRWLIALVFGLIHGFGFANVLQAINTNSSATALSLFGFNLGVELGQLLIISLFLPIAYLLRGQWVYQKLIVQTGSVLIILTSLVWLSERSLNIDLVGFL